MINSVFDNIFFEFGDLLEVKTQSLVARYNRALEKLTGKTTSLVNFHIDCTGFSPEIAKELNDDDYLDAHGMNKKFILVSMEQVDKDIVSTHFSSTMFMLKRFYNDNYRSLVSLTARDAVIGELDNKQFKANKAIDVIKSNIVHIEVDTSDDLLQKTEQCMKHVENVIDGDAWDDDSELESIISLSKDCGSLLKNDGLPRHQVYDRHYYYTKLFGGMYVFDDNDDLVIIVEDPLFNPSEHGINSDSVIFINEEKKVFSFLKNKGWINSLSFEKLRGRLDQIELKLMHSVLDKFIKKSDIKNFAYMDTQAIKNYVCDHYEDMPRDFIRLERLVNSLANNDEDIISNNEYRWFSHEVSTEVPNKLYALLNHLMSNFSTYSYFRMFVYNRQRFEELYKSWTDAKKEYIKTYLYDGSDVINELRSKQNVDLGV